MQQANPAEPHFQNWTNEREQVLVQKKFAIMRKIGELTKQRELDILDLLMYIKDAYERICCSNETLFVCALSKLLGLFHGQEENQTKKDSPITVKSFLESMQTLCNRKHDFLTCYLHQQNNTVLKVGSLPAAQRSIFKYFSQAVKQFRLQEMAPLGSDGGALPCLQQIIIQNENDKSKKPFFTGLVRLIFHQLPAIH